MNTADTTSGSLSMEEKLVLAREAFRKFRSLCFWFMREDAMIEEEDLPYICQRLRADGGREGFLLAARLCR